MRFDGQLDLALPAAKRTPPDYPAEARKELTEALAKAKAAIDGPPWPHRDQRMWRIVFPQMAGWLPIMEREPLVREFMIELDRIQSAFFQEHMRVYLDLDRLREAGL